MGLSEGIADGLLIVTKDESFSGVSAVILGAGVVPSLVWSTVETGVGSGVRGIKRPGIIGPIELGCCDAIGVEVASEIVGIGTGGWVGSGVRESKKGGREGLIKFGSSSLVGTYVGIGVGSDVRGTIKLGNNGRVGLGRTGIFPTSSTGDRVAPRDVGKSEGCRDIEGIFEGMNDADGEADILGIDDTVG